MLTFYCCSETKHGFLSDGFVYNRHIYVVHAYELKYQWYGPKIITFMERPHRIVGLIFSCHYMLPKKMQIYSLPLHLPAYKELEWFEYS